MEISEFKERLRASPHPVVVDLWAPWCAPCRMMKPALQKIEKQFEGQVEVWEINVDEQAEVARSLGAWSIPTLIAFKGEREITRSTGAQAPQKLEAFFQAALAGEPPQPVGLSLSTRLLRLLAALLLLVFGWLSGPSYLLLAAGGLVLFSAVYDRCPIWKAVTGYIKRSLRPA
jgi:thioredoxin 1